MVEKNLDELLLQRKLHSHFTFMLNLFIAFLTLQRRNQTKEITHTTILDLFLCLCAPIVKLVTKKGYSVILRIERYFL